MSLEHRPTFTADVEVPLEEVQLRLRDGLDPARFDIKWARRPNARDQTGQTAANLVLSYQTGLRHFWSPWLTLDLAPAPSGTHLHGRFSPHPAVWTAFAFTYLGVGVLSFFSLMFAFSQWTLGDSPSALWGIAAGAVIASILWWASLMGQRLAREQMTELRAATVRAVNETRPLPQPLAA